MCLTTNKKEPFIAKKDIECYKIYKKTIFKNYYKGYVYGGFYHLIPEKIIRANRSIRGFEKIANEFGDYDILGGAIHSYTSYNELIRQNYQIPDNYCIFKCIIPKGTKYYIDIYGNCYASRKIKIVEKYETGTNRQN